MSIPDLILASQSASRRRMLAAAGVPHHAVRSPCDEEAEKTRLRAAGRCGAELALGLAEAKAAAVEAAGTLVLGCDQVLVAPDGSMLDKAGSRDELAGQLRFLSGQVHQLVSAAMILEEGRPVWSAIASARMTMRPLTDSFIAAYLDQEGEALLGCVGGYRIEGLGAQLFSAVDGCAFVVQGLPLFPLLDFLRTRNILPS